MHSENIKHTSKFNAIDLLLGSHSLAQLPSPSPAHKELDAAINLMSFCIITRHVHVPPIMINNFLRMRIIKGAKKTRATYPAHAAALDVRAYQ